VTDALQIAIDGGHVPAEAIFHSDRGTQPGLYRAVIVRMQHHEPTRAYVARRSLQGKSKAEIIRCLKPSCPRYLGPAPPPCGPLPGRLLRRLDGYRSVNAAAESFFAALKSEMYYRQSLPTRARARFAVAEYIEVFYNRRRLHSTLGYRTPFEALTDHRAAAAAAA
jgi:transposase InsO family protein